MKRLGCWLLGAAFVLALCSCGTETDTQNGNGENAVFPTPNYNNVYNATTPFWGWGDTVFYSWDGFYNGSTSVNKGGRTQWLLSSRWNGFDAHGENYYGDFFVIGDRLYFLTESEHKDKAQLYGYDLASQSYEKLHTTDPLYRWLPTENGFVYTKATDSSTVFPLYLYSTERGEETLICDTVREFGIVDDKIRYITALKVNTLTLHEYDPATEVTTELGSFPFLGADAYIQYNFTPAHTVMTYAIPDDTTTLAVYTVGSEAPVIYTAPAPITSFVAGMQYAYAVCYDATNTENNGVYQVDLSNGDFKSIDAFADDGTRIHVVSDDELYILQNSGLIRVRTDVYHMNVPEQTKKKLFRQ